MCRKCCRRRTCYDERLVGAGASSRNKNDMGGSGGRNAGMRPACSRVLLQTNEQSTWRCEKNSSSPGIIWSMSGK